MKIRKLGRQGLEVPAVGLGCMGMSAFYGSRDDTESLRVLHRSLELGMNFWDTAEMYGPFHNEELIGRAWADTRRENVIIATKFAFRFDAEGRWIGLDSSPAHIRESIEGSLRRLRTDYIDLYYQHRLDPNTRIEDTVGALHELVQAGKVRYIGLSEVGPGTIRRANAVHPLTAIQTEYSLWEREAEQRVLPTLHELGIGFVAYSPAGRGFLTGRIRSLKDLDESDWRRGDPRFQGENFERNFALVRAVRKIASVHHATASQVALAWLLRQSEDIVPIPGTTQVPHLEEDARAVDLQLPESAWSDLREALNAFHTAGARYPEPAMRAIDKTE